MKTNILFAGIIAAGLLAFVIAGPAMTGAAAQQNSTGTSANATDTADPLGLLEETQTASGNGTVVEIGAGSNATVQYYTYTPQRVEIDAGESVTWSSSAELLELHTVTFADPSIVTDIILPFSVPSDADLELLPPFNAGEALTLDTPNGTAIVALNKLAWSPAVIDENNQTSYLNGTDIQYTMTGDEKALNSGIIQPPFPPAATMTSEEQNATSLGEAEIPPEAEVEVEANETQSATEGQDPAAVLGGPPFPMASSFTVTFENAGTYDYFCALHPWMTGQIVVNGDTSNSTSTSSADGLFGNTTSSTDDGSSNVTTFEEMANSEEP